MVGYFSIRADDELWERLSPELRGRDFRVPYFWREGREMSFKDWELLVKHKFAGSRLYIQKTKAVHYYSILSANKD